MSDYKDQQEFNLFVDEHRPILVRYGATFNPDWAEDVVQDVLIKAWKKKDEWIAWENPLSYLLTMIRNKFIDYSRKQKTLKKNLIKYRLYERQMENLRTLDLLPYDIDKDVEYMSIIMTIKLGIKELTRKDRSILRLKLDKKSEKEIAEILKITQNQVKVSIGRSRRIIKARLLNVSKDRPIEI